jgi:hypothetical protein
MSTVVKSDIKLVCFSGDDRKSLSFFHYFDLKLNGSADILGYRRKCVSRCLDFRNIVHTNLERKEPDIDTFVYKSSQ